MPINNNLPKGIGKAPRHDTPQSNKPPLMASMFPEAESGLNPMPLVSSSIRPAQTTSVSGFQAVAFDGSAPQSPDHKPSAGTLLSNQEVEKITTGAFEAIETHVYGDSKFRQQLGLLQKTDRGQESVSGLITIRQAVSTGHETLKNLKAAEQEYEASIKGASLLDTAISAAHAKITSSYRNGFDDFSGEEITKPLKQVDSEEGGETLPLNPITSSLSPKIEALRTKVSDELSPIRGIDVNQFFEESKPSIEQLYFQRLERTNQQFVDILTRLKVVKIDLGEHLKNLKSTIIKSSEYSRVQDISDSYKRVSKLAKTLTPKAYSVLLGRISYNKDAERLPSNEDVLRAVAILDIVEEAESLNPYHGITRITPEVVPVEEPKKPAKLPPNLVVTLIALVGIGGLLAYNHLTASEEDPAEEELSSELLEPSITEIETSVISASQNVSLAVQEGMQALRDRILTSQEESQTETQVILEPVIEPETQSSSTQTPPPVVENQTIVAIPENSLANLEQTTTAYLPSNINCDTLAEVNNHNSLIEDIKTRDLRAGSFVQLNPLVLNLTAEQSEEFQVVVNTADPHSRLNVWNEDFSEIIDHIDNGDSARPNLNNTVWVDIEGVNYPYASVRLAQNEVGYLNLGYTSNIDNSWGTEPRSQELKQIKQEEPTVVVEPSTDEKLSDSLSQDKELSDWLGDMFSDEIEQSNQAQSTSEPLIFKAEGWLNNKPTTKPDEFILEDEDILELDDEDIIPIDLDLEDGEAETPEAEILSIPMIPVNEEGEEISFAKVQDNFTADVTPMSPLSKGFTEEAKPSFWSKAKSKITGAAKKTKKGFGSFFGRK